MSLGMQRTAHWIFRVRVEDSELSSDILSVPCKLKGRYADFRSSVYPELPLHGGPFVPPPFC